MQNVLGDSSATNLTLYESLARTVRRERAYRRQACPPMSGGTRGLAIKSLERAAVWTMPAAQVYQRGPHDYGFGTRSAKG